MSLHIIIGRGATARTTAALLAADGEQVRMVSRTGTGPDHPAIENIALDANDAAGLTELSEGASTIFNLAMPAYHTWPVTVPPLFGAIRTAAENTGADYVILSNLYGYGPLDGLVTEETPQNATGSKGAVRARMWTEAKAAHDAGRLRATEVRAGQFLGAGVLSLFTFLVAPKVLSGNLVLVPAELDAQIAYAYIGDVARTLVAAARHDESWGRVWHARVISGSVRATATRFAELAGAPAPRLEYMTERDLTLLGLTDPFWNEVPETSFLEHGRFTVDSSHTEKTLGVTATALDEVLREMLQA